MSLMGDVQKFIESHPGCTSSDIANAFADFPRKSVLQSTSKLRQCGRIAHRFEGKTRRHFALETDIQPDQEPDIETKPVRGREDGGMKLTLPFPPSVNTYWRHPNKGPFAGKSLISVAGRKFRSATCAAIIEQLRRLPKPTSTHAAVEIILYPPDKRIRDLDNYNKALFDALPTQESGRTTAR